VLGELARVLRPGGSLFVSVPFVWHLHQEPHDRFRFSLHALEYLIAKRGLTATSIRPQGGYFSVLRYVLSSYTLVTHQLPQPWRTMGELSSRVYKLVDLIAVAPLCYLLDKLDHGKKLTLGYFLHLRRPDLPEKSMPEDPYCCPLCLVAEPDLIRHSEEWICSHCGTVFQLGAGVPNLTPLGSYSPVSENIARCASEKS
jgi:ribosomal protein L37AE/L43A